MEIPVITLDGVDTIYQGERYPAIKDINLEVARSEFDVVLGPNGVGKTTLLETINGLLKVSAGQVRVLDKQVSEEGSSVRREVGYLPQEVSFDSLAPFLVQNVVLMGRYGKMGMLRQPSTRDRQLAREALDRVDMLDQSRRPVGKLSGGQQQKVLVARMLAKEPRVLLLDEPFSNLDFVAQKNISDLLTSLHDQLGLTTMMVLHNLSSIPDRCDRVILMGQGCIHSCGTPAEILQSDPLDSVY